MCPDREKGVRKKKGNGHACPLRKAKIPLWESANLNHSPEGTPDATLSGQSGKLRQDAATVMKYSCLPTGNLECLSARRRCREGAKIKAPDNRSRQYTPGAQEPDQNACASVKDILFVSGDGVNLYGNMSLLFFPRLRCGRLQQKIRHGFQSHDAAGARHGAAGI